MVMYVAHEVHPWCARFPVDTQETFGQVHFLPMEPRKE